MFVNIVIFLLGRICHVARSGLTWQYMHGLPTTTFGCLHRFRAFASTRIRQRPRCLSQIRRRTRRICQRSRIRLPNQIRLQYNKVDHYPSRRNPVPATKPTTNEIRKSIVNVRQSKPNVSKISFTKCPSCTNLRLCLSCNSNYTYYDYRFDDYHFKNKSGEDFYGKNSELGSVGEMNEFTLFNFPSFAQALKEKSTGTKCKSTMPVPVMHGYTAMHKELLPIVHESGLMLKDTPKGSFLHFSGPFTMGKTGIRGL